MPHLILAPIVLPMLTAGLMLLLLVLLFDQATRALQQLLWHRSEPC